MDHQEPSQKCQKIDLIDRISNLPNAILGEILYYLPTKDAVATSVLSTRWKTLFPRVLNRIKLDLDDSKISENSENEFISPIFVNFVDKLFNETLLHVSCIERISIQCDKDHGDEEIVSWVRSAVRLKVVYLKLKPNLVETEPLFECLNGCTTLEELEFETHYQLLLPKEKIVLPNLKVLHLRSLVPLGKKECTYSIHELIDGCPSIEELSINGCDFDAMEHLSIRSSTLKRLFIEDNFNERKCEVEIDAPNLEVFVYDGRSIDNYAAEDDFMSLNSVLLDFRFSEYYSSSSDEDSANLDGSLSLSTIDSLENILSACSETTRLGFVGKSIEALQGEYVELPEFENLNFLALGRMGSRGFRILAKLLKKAPNLETLTFEEGFKNISGGYAIFESTLRRVPDCLKLCFKKLVIWDFKGKEDEMKLIEYFLKNGRELQEVIVYYVPIRVDYSILNELIRLPKCSQTCQILTRRADNRQDRSSRYARTKWF